MAVDERNFRSTYYEKVGFKSVEEKKSLEILLKDKTLDRVKLKQFCLRFSVPSVYRSLVWKVLLDVIPPHVKYHEFVMDQRRQEYRILTEALLVMRIVEPHIPKPQFFYSMWLLQAGRLHCRKSEQKSNDFIAIASALQHFFEEDADLYWVTKQLYAYVERFRPDIAKLAEAAVSLLEKEDPALHNYLRDTGMLGKLPMTTWLECCFAGLLNENALGRIWDKLCGGSCKILAFIIVVLLTNQRHKLLKCVTVDQVLQCVTNLPEEGAEIVASKAIDMWQQHGSPLTVYDKPKP